MQEVYENLKAIDNKHSRAIEIWRRFYKDDPRPIHHKKLGKPCEDSLPRCGEVVEAGQLHYLEYITDARLRHVLECTIASHNTRSRPRSMSLVFHS